LSRRSYSEDGGGAIWQLTKMATVEAVAFYFC
jgi:hypothetical protein